MHSHPTEQANDLDLRAKCPHSDPVNRTNHPRVAKWIDNFPLARRDAAALLIDGLRLVSGTDLRRELGDLVQHLAATLPGPIATFPAREIPKGESAHGAGGDGGYAIIEPALPGSEAIIANMLKGVQRQPASAQAVLPALDLPLMRCRKVRTILLVDDFSGSGSRLLKYELALRRHATVRSWASGGYLDFHVVAYAATEVAILRLERRFGTSNVHILHPCPTFAGAGWSPEQLVEVEALCLGGRRETRRPRRRGRQTFDFTFGFENSRALIAFEHTAPNNLPLVMWKTGEAWNSLFEGKAVPRDLLSLFTMMPGPPREPHAGAEGSKRLGMVVELLKHRVKSPSRIAEATGVSMAEAGRLLMLAKSLNLVGPSGRLTDMGMAELARRCGAQPKLDLPNRDNFYYPTQLRAER